MFALEFDAWKSCWFVILSFQRKNESCCHHGSTNVLKIFIINFQTTVFSYIYLVFEMLEKKSLKKKEMLEKRKFGKIYDYLLFHDWIFELLRFYPYHPVNLKSKTILHLFLYIGTFSQKKIVSQCKMFT